MRCSFQPNRAGTRPIGEWVRRRDEASALRVFVLRQRWAHTLGGEAYSGNAYVPSQACAEFWNDVAVVGLRRVGHRKIRLAPIHGRRLVGVEKSLERPILHVLGDVVLA